MHLWLSIFRSEELRCPTRTSGFMINVVKWWYLRCRAVTWWFVLVSVYVCTCEWDYCVREWVTNSYTCMYVHVRSHARTCAHTHTHVQIYTHADTWTNKYMHAHNGERHTHTCTHARAHTHKQIYTYAYTYERSPTRMHEWRDWRLSLSHTCVCSVCVCVRVCVYVCVCVYNTGLLTKVL